MNLINLSIYRVTVLSYLGLFAATILGTPDTVPIAYHNQATTGDDEIWGFNTIYPSSANLVKGKEGVTPLLETGFKPYSPVFTSHAKLGGACLFEDFTLEGLLGEGGFGKVYRATHHRTNQTMALKWIDPQLVNQGPQYVYAEERFQHDLEHPNIAPIYCTMLDDKNDVYFVLDYYERGAPQVKDLKNDSKAVAKLTKDLLAGLHFLHQHGVAHLDIKPGNTVIDKDGTLRIIDFGISQKGSSTSGIRGKNGTIAFMAPEVLLDESYGMAADYFSAGIFTTFLLKEAILAQNTDIVRKFRKGQIGLPSFDDSSLDLLLKRLANGDPQERWRLCFEEYDDLINMEFFGGPPSGFGNSKQFIVYGILGLILAALLVGYLMYRRSQRRAFSQ